MKKHILLNGDAHPLTIPPQPMMRLTAGTALAAAAILAGCASAPAPREEMAVARASVDRATSTAGQDAAVDLAAARDKLERANVAMTREDYDTARRLAEQADADANLAEARARTTRSEAALREVREGVRQLRDEMNRRAKQ